MLHAPQLPTHKWGYIDKTGKYVIASQFDACSTFFRGLASVRVGDKWGYIDLTGRYTINPQFDQALPFFEGGQVQLEK